MAMAVVHISEADAARDFAALLARVRAGTEVVIDDADCPTVVLSVAAEHSVRRLSESLRLAREHGSTAVIDENFARDVEASVDAHPEPLNPPAWD